MKYAIIEISGKQFWIETGKFYDFNRISLKLNKRIILTRVLLFKNKKVTLLGKPYLPNIKITGKIIDHLKGNKLIIYKMKPKKKTRKKQGHRQKLTRILIENILIKK
uniref:50S ribosomal protein L21 n=1 Tax=Nitzschia alba TaxID=2858 RepID=A0A5C0F4Y3_NITAL|nr:50S ribosomal protein L21 [Nitzschia alba]QEI59575.1 50S ribosomal protein L21 [Nitzschia alba]